MEMTILQRDDNITHVVLAGRLDSTGTEEIGERFSDVTAGRERSAIVDLSKVEFLGSRGIGLLFATGKKLMQAGHKLILLNPQSMVGTVLKTVQAEKVALVVHDLDEAERFLQGGHGEAVVASPRPTSAVGESSPRQPESAFTAPSAIEGSLKLAIKNELSELEDLNTTLAQFLADHHVPHRAAYAVNLAIDELVVNVIRYAYVDDDTHTIDIELAIERDQGILRIVDDGRPFDPRTGPSLDMHAEDRDVGGLGLILVLDMVDVLDYRRVDEKNWVEVRVHLIADAESDDLSRATDDSPKASDP